MRSVYIYSGKPQPVTATPEYLAEAVAKELQQTQGWQAITLVQFATTYIALFIITMLALRHAGSIPMRVLSFAMLAIVPDTFISYLPWDHKILSVYLFPIEVFVGYVYFTYFCLIFPEGRPHWDKAGTLGFLCLRVHFLVSYNAYILVRVGWFAIRTTRANQPTIWRRSSAVTSVILSLGH